MNTTNSTNGRGDTAAQTIFIPGAFYDMMFERGVEVPLDEEFRKVGKGKQYEVRRDALFDSLVGEADKYLSEDHHGSKVQGAAISFLRAVRKQGVQLNLTHELPTQNARRWIWTKTDAVVPNTCGKYRGRKLLHGIDRISGTIAIRIAGTRQVYYSDLPFIFSGCVDREARRARAEKKAAKKAARLARKRAAK